MNTYLLAVDGGGTKTAFYLSDLRGTQVEAVVAGSSNYKSVGIEKCARHLGEGLDALRRSRGIGPEQIAYAVFGMSGCDCARDYDILSRLLSELGFAKERVHLCNDGILAFYAQAAAPGVAIIAGTGSIVVGVDRAGVEARAGGWGYNVSDLGSGYWIGSEALKSALLFADGCAEPSALYESIKRACGAKDFSEMACRVTAIRDNCEIAKFASVVCAQARLGDRAAKNILESGARYLSLMAARVADKLRLADLDRYAVVLSGGVLRAEIYRDLVIASLAARLDIGKLEIYHQENPPAVGGIRLAMEKMKGGARDGTEKNRPANLHGWV